MVSGPELKILWSLDDNVWKGVGVFCNYYCHAETQRDWYMQVVNAYGHILEVWKGKSLKACKSQAGLIERKYKYLKVRELVEPLVKPPNESES